MDKFDTVNIRPGMDLLIPVVKPKKPKLCGICQAEVSKRVRRTVEIEIPGGGTTTCSTLSCSRCEDATMARHIRGEDGLLYSVPVIEVQNALVIGGEL